MIPRTPEPEPMNLPEETLAYAQADFSDVNQAFVERLLSLFDPPGPARIIDLGAGPADIPIRLAQARPAWHVTAVDVSPAMLDLARDAIKQADLAGRITLCLADAKHAAPLPAGPFDAIVSNSILHHVTDTAALWQQVQSLGQPGSFVFFRDLFRPASEAHARELVATHAGNESRLLQEEFYRSLLSAYTPQEIRRQLDDAGLSHLHVETVSDRHVDILGPLL
jgi:ubiquinone/menaquinone biosynthesis C-methylase UbiE